MWHAYSAEYPYFELDSEPESDTQSDIPLLYDTPATSPLLAEQSHGSRIRFSKGAPSVSLAHPTSGTRLMGLKKWFSRSKDSDRPLIDRISTPMDEVLTDEPPTTTDLVSSPPRGRKYRDQQREEYERRLQYEKYREREREQQDRYSVPRKGVQHNSARWHEHTRDPSQYPQTQTLFPGRAGHPGQFQQLSQNHSQPHNAPNNTHQSHLNPRYLGQLPRSISGYHQSLLQPITQVIDPRFFRTEGYPVPPVTYHQAPTSMQAEIVELKDDSTNASSKDKKDSAEEKKEKKEGKKEEEEIKSVGVAQTVAGVVTVAAPSPTEIEKAVKEALQKHRPAVYETLVRMNSYVLSIRLAICVVCVALYPLLGILLFVVLFGSEILLELAVKMGPD